MTAINSTFHFAHLIVAVLFYKIIFCNQLHNLTHPLLCHSLQRSELNSSKAFCYYNDSSAYYFFIIYFKIYFPQLYFITSVFNKNVKLAC